MLRLLIFISVLICHLAASDINVSVQDSHTVIIKAADENGDELVDISAQIQRADGIKMDVQTSKKPELVIYYPGLDFTKGFKVVYTVRWSGKDGVRPEKGSFTFNAPNSLRRRKRNDDEIDVESRFGFGTKYKPKHHGLGFFPRGHGFPQHGPPPFWPAGGFGPHHHNWDHDHHKQYFDPCDKPEHNWGSNEKLPKPNKWNGPDDSQENWGSNEKFPKPNKWNGPDGSQVNWGSNEKYPKPNKWNGPDDSQLDGSNWNNNDKKSVYDNTIKPISIFTPTTPTTTTTGSTEGSTTFPKIDIRFKKD